MPESNFLFLIPDIGGFTKFVTSTDAEHSELFTAELLECLINAADPALKTRNLEGDAVFFAREGDMPDPTAFMEQISAFYTAFHQRLNAYAKSRMCNCNACASVSRLTLKIIAHYGRAAERTIAGHAVLHGKDVILVHRLLKNQVPEKEYLLLTEAAFQTWSDGARAAFSAVFPVAGTQEFPEGLDPLYTLYLPLEPLKNEVPPVPDPAPLKLVKTPVTAQFALNVPLADVYGNLLDLEQRSAWNTSAGTFEYQHGHIHRIGTKYAAAAGGKTMAFETVGTTGAPDELVYAEKTGKTGLASSVGLVYRFRKAGDGVVATIEAHPQPGLFGYLLPPLVRREAERLVAAQKQDLLKAFGSEQ